MKPATPPSDGSRVYIIAKWWTAPSRYATVVSSEILFPPTHTNEADIILLLRPDQEQYPPTGRPYRLNLAWTRPLTVVEAVGDLARAT